MRLIRRDVAAPSTQERLAAAAPGDVAITRIGIAWMKMGDGRWVAVHGPANMASDTGWSVGAVSTMANPSEPVTIISSDRLTLTID